MRGQKQEQIRAELNQIRHLILELFGIDSYLREGSKKISHQQLYSPLSISNFVPSNPFCNQVHRVQICFPICSEQDSKPSGPVTARLVT